VEIQPLSPPRARRRGCASTGGDELLADRPDRFDWPEVDERDAAALCYTSGTTGNPKGVAYSHRSIYLHSMQVCSAESFGLGPASTVLAVVADVPRDGLGDWPTPRSCPARRC